MWVKICANTTAGDAEHAVSAGADAVGFVFAPSPRRVSAAQVRAISEGLPAWVERVGVFAVSTAEEIASAYSEGLLTTVQLHGGDGLSSVALARQLEDRLGRKIPIIFSVHWPVEDGGESQENAATNARTQLAVIAAYDERARVLIDAKVGGVSGGLGRAFPWEVAQPAFQSQELTLHSPRALKLIVAGGLTPTNVGEAISLLHPWGVDVASGVERTPGIKDHEKVGLFIRNAREERRPA